MRFFLLNVLGNANDESLCFLDNFVKGIESSAWRVGSGEPFGSEYIQDARIYMNPENPGIKLSSFLGNTRNMVVGSKELKAAIEKHCPSGIEYLPFTLYDHRGRVYSRDYFIINPIGTFDCLDFKASQIVWDDEDPNEIISIRTRVLDLNKMKDAPQLFRIDRSPSSYVLGLELVRELKSQGFTNIRLSELNFSDNP